MSEKCLTCPYAEWDYEEYYGSRKKDWFVCDCKLEDEECETGRIKA